MTDLSFFMPATAADMAAVPPGELARAMQVDKPPAELPDQLDMFGGDAA